MHENLQHWSTPDVDIFYLLWSNVFSLGQLENVLFTVNDLQSSILCERENSISVFELSGWCQWIEWQSHRYFPSVNLISLETLEQSFISLCWLWGKGRGAASSKNLPILFSPCGESRYSLRKNPQDLLKLYKWLPRPVKKLCSSEFPIT